MGVNGAYSRLVPPPQTGPMGYIGRVDALEGIFGMQLNPLTGALYAGFSDTPDAQMFTTSATGLLPVDQGEIVFGEGDGIYANKVNRRKPSVPWRSSGPSSSKHPSCTLPTNACAAHTRHSSSTASATSSSPPQIADRRTSTSLTWAPGRGSPPTWMLFSLARQKRGRLVLSSKF